MLEEKTEFVQTYFNNPDFQNIVNTRVYQVAVSQLRYKTLFYAENEVLVAVEVEIWKPMAWAKYWK